MVVVLVLVREVLLLVLVFCGSLLRFVVTLLLFWLCRCACVLFGCVSLCFLVCSCFVDVVVVVVVVLLCLCSLLHRGCVVLLLLL